MGVPKFFRWVAERYPLVITPFQDSPPPVDNLYLDMNGIIHNCSHPNDIDPNKNGLTEKNMVEAMFAYLEKLFQAIQPTKYFFLAIDGCAPRAKMNQQRQRRYRSGYEMMVNREEALARGEELPEEGDVFDSNCITPGTEFMHRVGEHFKYFITMKIQQDSAWRNCKIIFSGHDQPGEGEHKIVDFIRRRKMQPDYSPDEKHCMYGLDADLIMLALATHEPNFILLREVVSFNQATGKEKQRQLEDEAKGIKEAAEFGKPDTFVLFHIKILREYLDKDVRRNNTYANYDLERVLDDFVFMCIFVGNDFMPSLPTLGINDGSITTMFDIYREHVLAKGTNLLRGGKPNWNAVDTFLAKLGELELETIRNRHEEEMEYQKRRAKMDPGHEIPTQETPIASMAEFKEHYYGTKHAFPGGWEPRSQDMFDLKQHYVEGLMWVLEYYYQGPPSWKWYYPHHYAPMASDLVNLTVHGTNVKFDKGQPFLPHQQLLAVLPPMSYRSMPKAYWPLLRSANSPLHKYFPTHLMIDREGARAPWEGVVLIPFIDEKVLLASYNSVQAQLTEADRDRNREGPALLFQYDADLPPYQLRNGMFSTLEVVRVQRTPYHMPEMPHPFVPRLCDGVRLGKQLVEGYGSLSTHEHEMQATFEVGATSVFGRPSRKESLLLSFHEGEPRTAEEVQYLMGQEVWICYPHLKRARVCCIVDRHRRISAQWDKDGNFMTPLVEQLTAEEYRQFKKESDLHQQFLKEKCGIVLPSIEVFVYVNRFVGMRISRKGRFMHHWSRKDTCYPLQLIERRDQLDIIEDARCQERDRSACDFNKVQQVLYIGPDPKGHKGESVTGSIGQVVDTTHNKNSDDFNTVLIRQFTHPQPVPQPLLDAAAPENWMPLHQLVEVLRTKLHVSLSAHAVSQLCGTLTTSSQWGSHELGLCLKFAGKNLARVGLCKLVATSYNPWYVGNGNLFETMEASEGGHYLDTANDGRGKGKGNKPGDNTKGLTTGGTTGSNDKGQWYFSLEALNLIGEYVQKFMPLVHRIMAGGIDYLNFDVTSMMSGVWQDMDPGAAMKMIVDWLAEKGLHDLPMISATDDAFTKGTVEALEEALLQTTPRPTQEVRLRRVLSRHVHYPAANVGNGAVVAVPLPSREQRYALGNRVVYARTTGIVPFGATGTIVRLLGDGKTADVVFDEAFVGGSHLGGRLSTTRGALVKLAALHIVSAKPTVVFDAAAPFPPPAVTKATTTGAAATEGGNVSQPASPASVELPSPDSPVPPKATQKQQQQRPAAAKSETSAPSAPAPAAAVPAPSASVAPSSTGATIPQPRGGVLVAPRPGFGATPADVAAAHIPQWSPNPPRHTRMSIRNALTSKVHELLRAKYPKQQ